MFFSVSYLEPAPTITMAVADSNEGIGMVITLKPFLRTFLVYFMKKIIAERSKIEKKIYFNLASLCS